jgi:hypothetical protein
MMAALFSIEEAANSLGIPSAELRSLAARGLIAATPLGKTLVITADEIARFREMTRNGSLITPGTRSAKMGGAG